MSFPIKDDADMLIEIEAAGDGDIDLVVSGRGTYTSITLGNAQALALSILLKAYAEDLTAQHMRRHKCDVLNKTDSELDRSTLMKADYLGPGKG